MIALVLLFAQYDPLPPPPPPDPGQQPFQPAQPAQPAQPGTPPHSTRRAAPAPYASQPAASPRSAPEPYEKPDRPAAPPQSHKGFQMAGRLGVALPAGSLSEDTAMAELAASQLPLHLDIGAKVSRHLFIGGYVSFALGQVTRRFEDDACRKKDCNARSAHIGAQIQWHFAPAERANPWLGYGIGYEWLWTSGFPETTYRGPEYARFMGGVDFRISHDFGLGPFIDGTLARYTTRSVGANENVDIDRTSLHSWVTVGLRLVLFP